MVKITTILIRNYGAPQEKRGPKLLILFMEARPGERPPVRASGKTLFLHEVKTIAAKLFAYKNALGKARE
jgi:hypothetical protein